MRLNSALVAAGLASSRRRADELISQGMVELNGQIVTGFSLQPQTGDRLRVGDTTVVWRKPTTDIIMLNKPKGYTSTHHPQTGQRSLFELLPAEYRNYKLAGRLDIDSEGLVILSNDGDFIQKLSHPRFDHHKVYRVTVRQQLTPALIQKLQQPHEILGHSAVAKSVKKISDHELEISISEGLNRQIRRMCGAAGLIVTRLTRIQLGPYQLAGLVVGQWRQINSR